MEMNTYRMRIPQLVMNLSKGIKDENVLGHCEIPRHLLWISIFLKFAPRQSISDGWSNISQPTVAFQTALQLKPHEKVLEVGTGSGYQTAVLVA